MPVVSYARIISGVAAVLMLSLAAAVQANDKAELVASSQQALVKLRGHASGAGPLLDKAAGVLVYPEVVKVGFGGAAEYGEGCLLVDGKAVAFFSTSGATYGLPLGAGVKSEVLLFMTAQALQDFRASQTWKVGVDGDVVMVRVASGGGVDATSIS
ncbi:MAG: hypothetical protein OEV47_18785, partial [Gammaproteobacteria bacterium]|nr:hypothetical protein [Gammaproteobacteria bacterium]